jgi:hypothetical protein
VIDPLILTFAEIEFLLASCPQGADTVRADLRTGMAERDPVVVRAGLASLLARGLCSGSAQTVVPGPAVATVIAAVATSRTHTVAAGWRGARPDVMHLYSGPTARLALFPNTRGQYTVEILDPYEPLSLPLLRFLDAFCAYATDGRESALVIKSRAVGGGGEPDVSIAVAIDAAGVWSCSDSRRSPDRGIPAPREQIALRIAELVDQPADRPGPAAA